MNNSAIIQWIECDGGPHLFVEKRLVEYWMGSNILSDDGNVITDKLRFGKQGDIVTDYDRACDIEDYIGIISIGNGHGLVISEDVPRSTWISSEDGNGGFLVVLNYIGEDTEDSLIIEKIRTADDSLFESTNLQFTIQDNHVCLFAACDYGPDWLYEYSESQLKPDTYTIDTIDSYVFDECSFRIHRLRKA